MRLVRCWATGMVLTDGMATTGMVTTGARTDHVFSDVLEWGEGGGETKAAVTKGARTNHAFNEVLDAPLALDVVAERGQENDPLLRRQRKVDRAKRLQCGVSFFILDWRRGLAPAPKVPGPNTSQSQILRHFETKGHNVRM